MPWVSCAVCGEKCYRKPKDIVNNKHGIACSQHCSKQLRSQFMKGNGNHQYGLIGDKNASFKNIRTIKRNNKYFENMIYVGSDYKGKHEKGRVREHRFLVELYWYRFDEKYFDVIDGRHYLKSDVDVHHIDFNHYNNFIFNLQPLTKKEHRSLHNKARNMIRDSKGRYVKSA